jgi:dienelactone hydrolase
MKRLLTTFALLGMIMPFMNGQDKAYKPYEVEGFMPSFYEKLKDMLTFPDAWDPNAGIPFDTWRAKARSILFSCMEILPPAPKSYNMKVLAVEQRKGYKAEKILVNISEWSRVPAYLLVPDGKGPFPAIVMLHDHGAHFTIGKEKMVRPFAVADSVVADADLWAHNCYEDQYVGDYFAANGYVVLAVDALFWGERGRKEGASYNVQQALASNLLQMGTSWGSIITMDDVRSAEFLASLPEVNPKKVGSLGFSMGAYRSWMLAAATDVVAASASVCWMNTTEHLMTLDNNQNKGGSAFSMIVPNIRRYMDYPHVASIACPKPALFFNGSRDKLFPVEGVKEAYSEMEKVWKSQHAGNKFVGKIWDETHFFNKAMQKETLLFFNQWLKNK